MKLSELQAKVHNQCLDLRSLHRLVRQDTFSVAWDKAGDTSRLDVIRFCDLGSIESVRHWIRHWEERDLESLSLRRLREKASRQNVPGYSRMSRSDLIASLTGEADDV